MPKSQQSRTTLRNKCDRLFSQLVRAGGVCERCGKTAVRLETSHVLSRRYANTRCDFRNAFCLCSSCHRWVGANPLGHAEFFLRWHADRFEDLGSDRVSALQMARKLRDELQYRAYEIWDGDWAGVLAGLEAQAKVEGPR